MEQNQRESYLSIVDALKKISFAYPFLGLNGRCGGAIFLFKLSQKLNNTEVYDLAIELIEQELNEINIIENLSLYNGLCGIAWTVQYLSDEDFIDLNEDSFIQYMEKHFIQFKDNNHEIKNLYQFQTFIDLLFYFSSRYISVTKKKEKVKYAGLLNQILIILTHQFYKIQTFEKLNNLSHQNLYSLLQTLIYLIDIDFQSPLIKPLIKISVKQTEKNREIENINSYPIYILQKATLYTSKARLSVAKMPLIKGSIQNDKKKELNNNMGIWDNSNVHDAIKNICSQKYKKDLGLHYILECQYNSY